MSKPKYQQGKRICTVSEFDQCKSIWYKWNGRTAHRSVLMSLQYRTLLEAIAYGRLYTAERKEMEESEMNYYSLKETSMVTGVKVRTLRHWLRVGKLKATKKEGSPYWRVSEDEVMRIKHDNED